MQIYPRIFENALKFANTSFKGIYLLDNCDENPIWKKMEKMLKLNHKNKINRDDWASIAGKKTVYKKTNILLHSRGIDPPPPQKKELQVLMEEIK